MQILLKKAEEKILKFLQGCKGLGIDTMVLDDAWFGHRDNDQSSLGDWFVDKRKFPNGLQKIIDTCHGQGMNFGIWFEPEMISPDSDIFRAHPDWHLHVTGRDSSIARNQYVIDYSRKEVRDYIYSQMYKILSENDIDYVKWDFNRNLTEVANADLPPERTMR